MKLLSVLDHSPRLRVDARKSQAVPSADMCDLADQIERNGIDAVAPEALDDVVRQGQACGLHPEVAAVVGDHDAPSVVRERAFGLIHRRLADRPLTPASPLAGLR